MSTRAIADESPRYEVVDLGQSDWGIAFPVGLNDRGDAVGYLDVGVEFGGPRHAVAWIDGRMIDLTPQNDVEWASAEDISNRREIVGNVYIGGSLPPGGFRYLRDGLETLPSIYPSQQSAIAVDDRGFIYGRNLDSNFRAEPTVWDRQLRYYGLGHFGYSTGDALRANGWGQIIGLAGVDVNENSYHAFLWEDDQLRDLGTLGDHKVSVANSINPHGTVVGQSGPALNERAFVWTDEDGMVDLGDLGLQPRASAQDINDRGEIVGWSRRIDGHAGVVWIDGQIHDLNALIDPEGGWRISWASAINEAGQIVANARLGNISHAILLNPVDGPYLTTIGPNPGQVDVENRIEVLHATPGEQVVVLVGVDPGETVVPECPGMTVDIKNPIVYESRADANGVVQIAGFIPVRARGQRLLVQSVEPATCRISNLVVQKLDFTTF